MKNLYAELVECVEMGLSDLAIARITGLPKEAVAIIVEQIERDQMAKDLEAEYPY
jgi:phenylpyruvate tautomerase PptA (4-oxalocrotonate tautomerase family)